MSVTFYDPENTYQYDAEYNIVNGGPEANFSNSNAGKILEILGLEISQNGLYGEVCATDLIPLIDRAKLSLQEFCDGGYNSTHYFLRSLDTLKQVAEMSLKHSNKVCWG